MKQDEIHNNFIHWTACHFDKYNFSFSQRKTRSVFCYKKNCKLYFQQLCKAVQASFARTGGSSLASESCTIRKSWKKIQLPFITCNSANHERHFHNNGQVHTLILTYHLQVSANVASTHPTGQRTFSQCNAAGTSTFFGIIVNKSVPLSCHENIAENTLENMNAAYSSPDTCSDVGYLISTSRW